VNDELERMRTEAVVPGGSGKDTEMLTQNSWNPYRNLNQGTSEYVAKVLATLRCSASRHNFVLKLHPVIKITIKFSRYKREVQTICSLVYMH
jgi:hypothetical protein